MGFLGGSDYKESAHNVGDLGSILGLGRSPGGEHSSHSSNITCRIPWTEEPNGLQSSPSTKSMCQNRRNVCFQNGRKSSKSGVTIIVIIQLLSCVQLFATPWTAACQASLSFTVHCSLLKLMSFRVGNAIQPFYPLLPPSAHSLNLSQNQGFFFPHESALHSRWPKYWNDYRE